MKLSKEDAEVLVSRLKKTSPSKKSSQIRDGQEVKIVNFKSRCAAKKTVKDLPKMMQDPQNHWFEGDIEGMGGRLKKSSNSYFRLQAFVSNLKSETDNEIDRPSEPAHEHA